MLTGKYGDHVTSIFSEYALVMLSNILYIAYHDNCIPILSRYDNYHDICSTIGILTM